jgi:hypothetical protein
MVLPAMVLRSCLLAQVYAGGRIDGEGEGFCMRSAAQPAPGSADGRHPQKKTPQRICEWITALPAPVGVYDWAMVKAPLNVDLARLRHFLKSLEADAQITVGDVDLNAQEIEILKREIADIEGVLNGSPDHGTRAVLFQIDIDYGVDHHQYNGLDHASDAAVAKAA